MLHNICNCFYFFDIVGQIRVGDSNIEKFWDWFKPILNRGMGFFVFKVKNASEETLHLEITICDFKATYLLA